MIPKTEPDVLKTIQEALGDTEGKLTHEELATKCKKLRDIPLFNSILTIDGKGKAQKAKLLASLLRSIPTTLLLEDLDKIAANSQGEAQPCSAPIREHTILFTRDGGSDGVTDAAHCSFRCKDTDGKKALSRAVTKWVETTEEGRAAWEESCEDFNIGDLACHQSQELLAEWGIHDLKVQVMAGAESWDYFDRHLVLPNTQIPDAKRSEH